MKMIQTQPNRSEAKAKQLNKLEKNHTNKRRATICAVLSNERNAEAIECENGVKKKRL